MLINHFHLHLIRSASDSEILKFFNMQIRFISYLVHRKQRKKWKGKAWISQAAETRPNKIQNSRTTAIGIPHFLIRTRYIMRKKASGWLSSRHVDFDKIRYLRRLCRSFAHLFRPRDTFILALWLLSTPGPIFPERVVSGRARRICV